MPFLPFPEWKPDLSDYQGASSLTISGVVPRGDGYGPFPDFAVFTAALPAACRGYFFARNADGTIATFAGTATRLYKLNNTSFAWTDVSLGGSAYSGLSTSFNWQFVQFNNLVFATQQNAVLQVFDLTSSTAFANAAGSPPQASYIAIINRFLVLSGLLSQAYRVQWSGLNNVNASTSWDDVTLQSNYQDMADGGLTRGVAGGDQYGIVFQDAAVRSMTFNPGSPEVFDFYKISSADGMFAPGSAVNAGGQTFFCSTQGFRSIAPGAAPMPIGKEKFDRTFFADVDVGNLQLMIAVADPRASRVYWAYKSNAGAAGLFDKILVYDWQLQRGSIVPMSGQYLATLAKPGLTLEALDASAAGIISITGAADNGSGAIRLTLGAETASWTYGQADTTHAAGAAGTTNLGNSSQNTIEVYGVVTGSGPAINGNWAFTVHDSTHIDLTGSSSTGLNYTSGGSIGGALDSLPPSLDTFSTAALMAISGVNASGQVGFYSGPNLEADLVTAEQGNQDRRMRVRGLRPITDASAALCSVLARETLQATSVQSAEQAINALGLCPQNVSTRYARAKLRIPYGSTWSFATGVEPQVAPEGQQ